MQVGPIESGIPIPEKKNGPAAKYPVADLSIGESFPAPIDKIASIRQLVFRVSRRTGRKFSVLREDKETCRCWRIA